MRGVDEGEKGKGEERTNIRDSRLGRIIPDQPGPRPRRADGGDVDDGAAAMGQHARHDGLRPEEDGLDVQAHDEVEVGFAHRGCWLFPDVSLLSHPLPFPSPLLPLPFLPFPSLLSLPPPPPSHTPLKPHNETQKQTLFR